MPRYFKSGNNWYKQDQFHIHHDANNDIFNRYVKCVVDGVEQWRPIYSYKYEYSAWGACSRTCGGGTQTRTAQCVRSDGVKKSDNYCTKYGLTKAKLSQSCNTHNCTLYYRATSDDYQQMWVKYRRGDSWIDIGIGQTGCDKNGGCSTGPLSSAGYGAFTTNGNYDGQTIYCKYSHWDSNGTSWHAHLRLSVNGSSWTEHIVHFPYNGAGRHDAGSRSYYWFIWNTKSNTITYVAAATNASNTSCGSQGGYQYTGYMGQWWVNGSVRGCGTGEPF